MGPEGAVGVRDDLFSEYALDHCYDEMFDRSGVPREPYAALYRRLLELSPAELRHRQQDADSAFLHQGVTFTVYGDDQGTERIFPYDLLPRIITAREWETIERGLIQRLTALNLFLKDIYQDGRILKEGIVPRHLVFSAQHYRREMIGIRPQARHLRVGRGHGSGAAARRPVRRARRQPARAERRVVHADEPPDHQARVSRALHRITPCARSITTAWRCSRRCARSRRTIGRIRRSCC